MSHVSELVCDRIRISDVPTPRARFHPPQTSSNAMIPRSFIIPLSTPANSFASSVTHLSSSLTISFVTGTLVICNPS